MAARSPSSLSADRDTKLSETHSGSIIKSSIFDDIADDMEFMLTNKMLVFSDIWEPTKTDSTTWQAGPPIYLKAKDLCGISAGAEPRIYCTFWVVTDGTAFINLRVTTNAAANNDVNWVITPSSTTPQWTTVAHARVDIPTSDTEAVIQPYFRRHASEYGFVEVMGLGIFVGSP